MKERPILFSGPMVRAILEGRKTVTRRPVKLDRPRGLDHAWEHLGGGWVFATCPMDRRVEQGREGKPCPYGKPGDRLWVREAWRFESGWDFDRPSDIDEGEAVRYEADGWHRGPEFVYDAGRYRHARFMPRWASRLTLEVTGVGVERVQEITEADALAEGVTGHDPEPADEGGTIYAWPGRSSAPCPRAHFAAIWDTIYGKRDGLSWADNPWVWVVRFKRVTP